MKKIKTTDIIAGSAMPFKSGSLDHLQSANQEGIFSLAQSELFQRNGVSTGYAAPQALYGLGYSFTGLTWTIESGMLVFGSEMFLCDTTVGVVLGVGEVVVGTITTTYLTATNADPVIFSDSTSNNVHEIRKIVWSAAVSGTADFDFLDIQYMGRWIEQTYSAGDLTAQTGTWTIPGGAADFEVKTQRRGSTMVIDFYIFNSTVSSTPTYLSLSLASTDRIKSDFHGTCYYQNPAASPVQAGLCRVLAVGGTREIRFTPVAGSWTADAGTVDVYGQITIEMDCNES